MSDAIRTRGTLPGDHAAILAAADPWWGRSIAHILPRLFLDHFHTTSLVAEDRSGLAGFLVGFDSPSQPDTSYVHMVGVRPDLRRSGLARGLYGRFLDRARAVGRTRARAVTSPVNVASVEFHRSLGFAVTGPHPGYDGPSADRMVFDLRL